MSDTIRRLCEGRQYVVTRYAAGQRFTDGKADPPSSSEVTITALITPATGRDLQIVPEGMRSSQTISILTETELLTVDEETEQLPDEVSYLGRTYQVQACEPWAEAGNFYKALARKKG